MQTDACREVTGADDELGRWLSHERIATSELMKLLFEEMGKGTWSGDEIGEILHAALAGFGNGCCYYLASALSSETGLSILGFMRPDDKALIHAVLLDPATEDVFDIIGKRKLSEIRREIGEAVGAHREALLPRISDFDPMERSILLEIAEGLPWMPLAGKPVSRSKWARLLVAYVEARADGVRSQT